MYGKKYQWINWVASFGLGDSINRDIDDGCTYEELVTVSNRMLALAINFFIGDDYSSRPGIIGLVTNTYL